MPLGCQASAPIAAASTPLRPSQPSHPAIPPSAARRPLRALCSKSEPSPREDDVAKMARRKVLGSAILAPAVLAMPAWALLPDDDDADLIEKAKERRQQRIQADMEAERKFVKEGGYRNRRDESELRPVQAAVVQLSRSGAALEAGDTKGAAVIMSDGSWVGDFRKAGERLSAGNGKAERSLGEVMAGVGALQAAARGGGLAQSKKEFVAVASAITVWAVDAGVSRDIKGL